MCVVRRFKHTVKKLKPGRSKSMLSLNGQQIDRLVFVGSGLCGENVSQSYQGFYPVNLSLSETWEQSARSDRQIVNAAN